MGTTWLRHGDDLLKCRPGMMAGSLKSYRRINANDNAFAPIAQAA